jgi:hypothetical protein
MIKVEIADGKPLEVASHAGLKCYQSESPKMGQLIDVEGRLFDTSHHTTLQHAKSYLTFDIEGIAVGDITFGLHLCHPFYNSDQRSGRFCAKMFLEPDFLKMEEYIKRYWPEVSRERRKLVLGYIKKGVHLYHQNISKATEIARALIKKERPFATDKYLAANAPKIAQEQMRMFIPVIFPTGLDYTTNLTVLAAMHRTAWTPAMKDVISKMVDAVLSEYPELSFMFSTKDKSQISWAMELPDEKSFVIERSPKHDLISISGEEKFVGIDDGDKHPVDLLHFHPKYMDNSIGEIKTRINISTATMGQDQRHRTIRRGSPEFTGGFYLAPILSELRLEKEAREYFSAWLEISREVPKTLAMILAPYGTMVSYEKVGSFNAIAHEQGKRLCWCAQEEIYHAGLFLRQEIESRCGGDSKLLQIFEPPCYRTGKCAEGARYCGRDMQKRKGKAYFLNRSV